MDIATTEHKRTPMHVAAEHDQSAVIKLLCESGADIEQQDVNQMTPLHLAAAA